MCVWAQAKNTIGLEIHEFMYSIDTYNADIIHNGTPNLTLNGIKRIRISGADRLAHGRSTVTHTKTNRTGQHHFISKTQADVINLWL